MRGDLGWRGAGQGGRTASETARCSFWRRGSSGCRAVRCAPVRSLAMLVRGSDARVCRRRRVHRCGARGAARRRDLQPGSSVLEVPEALGSGLGHRLAATAGCGAPFARPRRAVVASAARPLARLPSPRGLPPAIFPPCARPCAIVFCDRRSQLGSAGFACEVCPGEASSAVCCPAPGASGCCGAVSCELPPFFPRACVGRSVEGWGGSCVCHALWSFRRLRWCRS